MKSLLMMAALAWVGCDSPTRALVENRYDDTAVYRVWYQTTLFVDPVAAGEDSDEQRTVPTTDFAYALLAPDWDITSSNPPPRLIPVRSAKELTAERGIRLTMTFNPLFVTGDCARGKPLTQEEADLITQRIFPGEFTGGRYDAKTCTFVPDRTP